MKHRHLVKGKKFPAHLDRRTALIALTGQFLIITKIIIRSHQGKLPLSHLRRKTIFQFQIVFRQPRDKSHSPKAVGQSVKHLEVDAAAVVTHTKRKPLTAMGIDKPTGRTLFLLHHRIPVVRLKIVPEKAFSKFYTKIFKFRKCKKKRPVQKLRIHRLF